MSWETLCAQKQAQLIGRIPEKWLLSDSCAGLLDVRDVPRTCGILDPLELEISELDEVETLLDNLRTGKWTCVQVTTAYLKRALIAHQLVNCLTEFWIDDALARAKELDEALVTTDPTGLLHGLPISLKDQFHVKGKELNMGFASWIGQISTADAALVTLLRRAGAVIYTRTNVPQTLMEPETDNHVYVYGVTVNPFNRSLTCGGSSGGEGAFIALKGSPLGIGTDIGGSIRIPAALNGLYGVKPVCRRVPYWGAANTMMGGEGMESSAGPIARTLNGCAVLLRAVAAGQPWDLDPNVNLMLWDEEAYRLERQKLSFAYFVDNGHVRALPPIRRAIQRTIKALEARGHQVIPWDVSHYPGMITLSSLLYASGGSADFDKIMGQSGEPRRYGVRMPPDPGYTVWDYWQLVLRRNQLVDGLRDTALDKLRNSPPYTSISGWHQRQQQWRDVRSIIVIPVTTANPSLDPQESGYLPQNEMDKYHKESYDADKFSNGPAAIQVLGRRHKEEELLAVGRTLDDALKAYSDM